MTISYETKVTAEPGKQLILIEREFDAPRELVFEAFTDAELFVEWMGPRNLAMTLETFEPRDGGSWRYIHRDEAGNAYGFHGVFHEVSAPERIIQTFEFEGLPERGHVTLETVIFEELPGGKTKIRMESVFRSVADRDGMVQSGMEGGLNDSFGRLVELLEKLKNK
ncbi:SRPBCC family protein [Cohnella nanjingensis]|uniref:SRPBCC family protein n=1 Tax=Cohnella nanjingensis TaxID=1387779 RepID=A0A7X0RQ49_9BACL|nr:SRPBCC family protein [Cohnella nanjingensis]MBB6670365.1 SRPBCC family protein [Cohnella nanjingensis]